MGWRHVYRFRFRSPRKPTAGHGGHAMGAILRRGRIVSAVWSKHLRRAAAVGACWLVHGAAGFPADPAINGRLEGCFLRSPPNAGLGPISPLCERSALLRAQYAVHVLVDLDFFPDEIGTRRDPFCGGRSSVVPHSSGWHGGSGCAWRVNIDPFTVVRTATVVLVGMRSGARFHRALVLLRASRLHPDDYSVASGR